MSDGLHGHGVLLGLGATTYSNATAIGNVISISGPDQSRDAIDKSTMDSSAKWRENIPGMLDGGEVSVEVNYDGSASGTAEYLDTQFTATAQGMVIAFSESTATAGTTRSYWAASGFMTALGHAIPFDDKITQSITFKITGTPTFTDVG